MTRVTITRKIDVRAAVPSWRSGMAQWEWKELTGSSMNGVNPTVLPIGNTGPSSRVNTWTCFTANPATSVVYSAANGGHSDYSGNEVVALDMSADSPSWSIIRQPTPAASVLSDTTSYADGRPPSAHGYWSVHFVPSRGRIFRFGNLGSWPTGNSPAGTHAFDIAANDWDGAGSYPNTAWTHVTPYVYSGQAQDASTENVYWINSGVPSLRRFNASVGTFSTLATIPNVNDDVGYYRPMAYDHTRGLLLLIGDHYSPSSGGKVWTNDGGSGVWANFTFTGTDVSTLAGQNRAGAHYNETLDRIVVKASAGATVYLVHPATKSIVAQATTGGTPPDPAQGVFGRFNYLPNLGGYAYYPTYTGNVWFLATE